MRVYYESLPSCDADWIEPELKAHFKHLADSGMSEMFWSLLYNLTFDFVLYNKGRLDALGISGFKSIVTNSAITFYPQLKQT